MSRSTSHHQREAEPPVDAPPARRSPRPGRARRLMAARLVLIVTALTRGHVGERYRWLSLREARPGVGRRS